VIADYHMHLRNGRGKIAHDASSVDPFVEAARKAGVALSHPDLQEPLG
jgi:hypothetical protein